MMLSSDSDNGALDKQTTHKCSYNDIAIKLIRDKLYLTALELYTELMESGREIKELKDYFSNPGHFEGQYDQPTKMLRCGSQQTLDSLDLTRFSEDGDRVAEEHVAVLEFELRKAKETINALRTNLTVVTEAETHTSPTKPTITPSNTIKPHEQRALNFLINEYLLVHGYKLTSITFADENEDQDLENWDDVGLNISKPAELLLIYRDGSKQTIGGYKNIQMTSVACQTEDNIGIHCPVELLKYSESVSSKNSFSSGADTPEKFEMVDKTKSTKVISDLVQSSNGNYELNDWTNLNIENEENLSENSGSNNQFNYHDDYITSLTNICPIKLQDNELLLALNTIRVNNQQLVHTLSESLLNITPNIIPAKREEAISLLVFAVILQKDAKTRDKLIQQLFALKKKPTDDERLAILSGVVTIAQNAQSNLVESELLPQCCEQIAHKHAERRLLIAEACRYLIPHISTTIRNSLLLSMAQQLMEDRSALVRASVVQTLAIIFALCADVNKYTQCEQLAFVALMDDSLTVVSHVTDILFPVLAKWALDNGLFASNLIKKLLQSLNDSLNHPTEQSHSDCDDISKHAIRVILVITKLLPFIVMYVAANEPVLDGLTTHTSTPIRPQLLALCSDLSNPNTFYTGKFHAGQILARFDETLQTDESFICPQLEWLLDIMLPELLNSLTSQSASASLHTAAFRDILRLFTDLCRAFGRRFVRARLRPLFGAQIASMEQMIANNATVAVQQMSGGGGGGLHVLLPVYLVAILCNSGIDEGEGESDDDDSCQREIGLVIRRFLYALPVCGVPVDCLEVSVIALSRHSAAMCDIVLAALWEGVVHARPLVRATTVALFAAIIAHCAQHQLNAKLVPALVTLACDTDLLVRIAAIPALGRLITDCQLADIHDKAYMQLQLYLSDDSVKDNHTLLRQLVVTLGNIVTTCQVTFRNEVILPQLSSITTNLLQTTNVTRKIDMATALIEAYVNTIYSPLQSNYITTFVLPGLKNLEQIILSNPPLRQHLDTVRAMLRETENRADLAALQQRCGAGDVVSLSSLGGAASGNSLIHGRMSMGVQGIEDMRQKVSKLFQAAPNTPTTPTMIKSNTLGNIHGLFKKK